MIRHLTCGNNLNWLMNLNMIYEKLLAGSGSGVLISVTQLVLFDWSNNTGAIEVKTDRSVLEEKSSFKILGLTFSSKPGWGFYIVSIAKRMGALPCSMKFLSLEVALYLYKSTMRPCIEYCCCVWPGTPNCYSKLLDLLQKRTCRTVGPVLNLRHIVEM